MWEHTHAAVVHRQSVVTPEDLLEKHPVYQPGGALMLAADDRIDNREDLIRQLRLNRDAEGLPDSSVFVAAIDKWGEDWPIHVIVNAVTAIPETGAAAPHLPKNIQNEWQPASATARMHRNIVHHTAAADGVTEHERDPSRELGAGVLLSGVADNLTLS